MSGEFLSRTRLVEAVQVGSFMGPSQSLAVRSSAGPPRERRTWRLDSQCSQFAPRSPVSRVCGRSTQLGVQLVFVRTTTLCTGQAVIYPFGSWILHAYSRALNIRTAPTHDAGASRVAVKFDDAGALSVQRCFHLQIHDVFGVWFAASLSTRRLSHIIGPHRVLR